MLHPLLMEPLELPDVGVSPAENVSSPAENCEKQSDLYGQSISELPVKQRNQLIEEIRRKGGSLVELDLP
jgi:hypothetical protein